MRAQATGQIRIDLLNDQQDIAEVAKFAAKFSYRALIQPSDDNSYWEGLLTRTGESFLRDDLAHLVYLTAMTDSKSVDSVLSELKDILTNKHHIDPTVPPKDQAGIGELHPDGH